MNSQNYIPVQFILFQGLGIVISDHFKVGIMNSILILTGSLVCLGLAFAIGYKKIIPNHYFFISTFLFFSSLGISSFSFNKQLFNKKHYINNMERGTNQVVMMIREPLKSSGNYNHYYADIIQINTNRSLGRIKLSVLKDSSFKPLNTDDKIAVISSFKNINGPSNPYQFNYKAYLAKKQVHHEITTSPKLIKKFNSQKRSLKGLAYSIRKKAEVALIKQGFRGDDLAVIKALLLGQRKGLSKGLIQNYQDAGVIHILAISGLHIGIILLFLEFAFKPLERLPQGIYIKLFLILTILWLFAFIAGLSASVIRAVSMYSAIAMALSTKKTVNTFKALVISAFLLLLFYPGFLFDLGFQLSYLAVLSIIWLQPLIYKLYRPKYIIFKYPWQLLSVTFAAQIGVLPLSLYYFQQFAGHFFIANLIILPCLGFILGLGFLIIILAYFDLLPLFLGQFYGQVISQLNNFIRYLAGQEFFVFNNIFLSLTSALLLYTIFVFYFRWIQLKKIKFLRITALSIFMFYAVQAYENHHLTRQREFIVFNRSRHTVISFKNRGNLKIFHDLNTDIFKDPSLKAYLSRSKIKNTRSQNKLKNAYSFGRNKLLLIDSLAIFKSMAPGPNLLLLTGSPKINLDRALRNSAVKRLIVDGSNFKSYIPLWRKTCNELNIKFHYTPEDGAFIMKF